MLFRSIKDSVLIFTEMLSKIKVNEKNMKNAAKYGYMNATDAADYLVSKGVPFRECHEIIGKIVLDCIEKNCGIEDLSVEELKNYSDKFEEDIYENIDINACIEAKKSFGSTSQESVERHINSKSDR